jgi:hypothetical protein
MRRVLQTLPRTAGTSTNTHRSLRFGVYSAEGACRRGATSPACGPPTALPCRWGRQVAAECVGEVLEPGSALGAGCVPPRGDPVRAKPVRQPPGGELEVPPGRVVKFAEGPDGRAEVGAPLGVVDTIVLPTARSVPALTDAQPLRTRPSRAFVMAKGNLPSMSLLIPGLFRVSRCWGARAHRGGLS